MIESMVSRMTRGDANVNKVSNAIAMIAPIYNNRLPDIKCHNVLNLEIVIPLDLL